jgi:hypothetical protein
VLLVWHVWHAWPFRDSNLWSSALGVCALTTEPRRQCFTILLQLVFWHIDSFILSSAGIQTRYFHIYSLFNCLIFWKQSSDLVKLRGFAEEKKKNFFLFHFIFFPNTNCSLVTFSCQAEPPTATKFELQTSVVKSPSLVHFLSGGFSQKKFHLVSQNLNVSHCLRVQCRKLMR